MRKTALAIPQVADIIAPGNKKVYYILVAYLIFRIVAPQNQPQAQIPSSLSAAAPPAVQALPEAAPASPLHIFSIGELRSEDSPAPSQEQASPLTNTIATPSSDVGSDGTIIQVRADTSIIFT